ncbi:lanthionine synthetase LanC family protein [Streptomyces sp. NPDC048172]|uniref:class III lanthionine synthetase LanKC N-terminal domain-containing protein n=1 Tax=Streptomyces sp. NPDC048172 TaxID=3365505 RepID=UPI0037144EA8
MNPPTVDPLPEHGWKLHISSRAATFPELAERLLPALLAEGCPFKLARSQGTLAKLNGGVQSPAAVGKAVTVYPAPGRVREFGLTLAGLTRGHEGPRVLSDRRIAPGAPVYYRYGPFRPQWYFDERNVLAIRIAGPDGELFDGPAGLEYRAPDWVADPFVDAVDAHADADADEAHPADGTLLGDRFRVVHGILRKPQGDVYRATDLRTGRTAVVKQARAYVGEDARGIDARMRVRNERRVLAALEGVEGVPQLLDHFSHGSDEYLATTDAGPDHLPAHLAVHGTYLSSGAAPSEEFVGFAAELAGVVREVHRRGVVQRDLTAKNVVIEDGRVRLIDFGISALDGVHLPGYTPGFAPLRQADADNEPPRPEDDLFALGMVLGLAAHGMTPIGGITTPGLARHRAVDTLHTLYGAGPGKTFVDLVDALLSEEKDAAGAALDALADATWTEGADRAAVAPPVPSPRPALSGPPSAPELLEHTLGTLLDGLDAALLDPDEEDTAARVEGGLYSGSAGVGLELLHHLDRDGVPALVGRLAAHAVDVARRVPQPRGLYVGTGGIDLFLARMTAAGLDAPSPVPPSPVLAGRDPGDDIFAGHAGIGYGKLLLHELDGDPAHLAAAREEAAGILARDTLVTLVGTDDSAMPETAAMDTTFGYAHGLAGVVDFLVLLAERTGDEELRAGARTRAEELRERSVPLAERSALPTAVPLSATWCKGLAGAARALWRAGAVLDEPEFTAAAHRIAGVCAGWIPWLENVTQCCGLCGVGEVMLDLAEWSGEDVYAEAAREAGRQLIRRSHGPDADPAFFAPDGNETPMSWGQGYTGVVAFLRRLTSTVG